MPSNHPRYQLGYWAAKAEMNLLKGFGIGLMMAPDKYIVVPKYFPYALDNGAFVGFDSNKFKLMLKKASLNSHQPLFVVVPDVVGSHRETLRMWYTWKEEIIRHGFKPAFVVQDGCKPEDVPIDAFCCFVGGKKYSGWKDANMHKFKGVCKWLHIGRCNSIKRILRAKEIGADSVDGSGFFKTKRQQAQLREFFEGSNQMPIL